MGLDENLEKVWKEHQKRLKEYKIYYPQEWIYLVRDDLEMCRLDLVDHQNKAVYVFLMDYQIAKKLSKLLNKYVAQYELKMLGMYR